MNAQICPSSTFLKTISPKTVPLEFVAFILPAQCQSMIEEVISPINAMTKEWKNGGLCPNCALNYKQQNFDSCEIVFDRLIEGVYQNKAD
jgi:hypothetical protein